MTLCVSASFDAQILLQQVYEKKFSECAEQLFAGIQADVKLLKEAELVGEDELGDEDVDEVCYLCSVVQCSVVQCGAVYCCGV